MKDLTNEAKDNYKFREVWEVFKLLTKKLGLKEAKRIIKILYNAFNKTNQ